MNIVFFSRLFYPHIGGVEKHVMEISRILIKKGHKIILITEQYSRDYKLEEYIEGIHIFRVPNLKEGKLKKFQIWKWLFSNYALIKKADIIHCHDVFFWYLPFRFLFPFKKVFTTFHGYEEYPLKPSSILMHKISEKLSNGNICIGDFMKKWYKTNPDFVSYGAVTIPNQTLQNLNKVKSRSAIFIGRIDKQTGILTYAEVVDKIRKTIPDFEFLVIGDGDLKSKINKKNKILNAVENATKYLTNYNFAFASRYLSILEAMAAKKIVFASYDNPLKEDYLKMAPFSQWAIISDSADKIASEVIYLLNDVERSKIMTKKAFDWVKTQTWENLAMSYLKLWNKIID
jgi:glycosyltransferase involved in cell wall biosynthesis